ncbi:putative mitochondrial precursor of DNA-directed RNA polymerase [Cercophora samala]|uniref:DNA-directed RNA polymerase n=1 Tax=Cercophora samala TaxID=330535 RepID=A0AA39ZBF1_9PEZI|nr:putative mitochondrial precursor of DNA-directed RNA polymerase [Cercophora samala]
MLVRSGATRHTLPVRTLLTSSALRYPSRCLLPSVSRLPTEPQRSLTTTAAAPELRPASKKTYRALVGFERNLATTVTEQYIDNVPFNTLTPLYQLRPIDVANTIQIPDQLPPPARGRMNQSGIPGDHAELLSMFDACLKVGRLERAIMVARRLEELGGLSTLEMLQIYHGYLRARIARIEMGGEKIAKTGASTGDDVFALYETRIHGELPLRSETIGYMLKLSLLCSTGSKLRTRVTRFMGLLPHNTTMDLGDILSAEDLARIAKISPSFTYTMSESSPAEPELKPEPKVNDDSTQFFNEAEPAIDFQSSVPPEVLATTQKGLGLTSLKKTISLFAEIPEGRDIASLPLGERKEIQSRLEKDTVEAAVDRWRKESQAMSEMGLSVSSPGLNARLYEWHTDLQRRIAKETQLAVDSEAKEKKTSDDLVRCQLAPYLLQSSPERLAAVVILSLLSLVSVFGVDKGVPLTRIVHHLASTAEEDIRVFKATQSIPKNIVRSKKAREQKAKTLLKVAKVREYQASINGGEQNLAEAVDGQKEFPSDLPLPRLDPRWPTTTKTKFGALLLGAFLDTAKVVVVREHPETKELVSQMQPAFSHTTQLRKGKKVGVIIPNRALVDIMKTEPRGEVLARHLPMVVEPEPWTQWEKGGFLEYPTSVVRAKAQEKDQQIYTEAAIERGDMEQMMKGLDVLGQTAWRINRKVFNVMLEAWNTGTEVANIPALNPNLPIPPAPESPDDPLARRAWLKAVKAVENEKGGLHSQRCFMNFQLEIARAFRDQTFYFPHNLDFRGRAYPVPTYLNHMGADHMRGLLKFAKGKPLGTKGLRWLKIHLANVYGFDKASLAEREEFANQNHQNILDSVRNPLNGSCWWLKAEDPWQCLATCFELADALEHPDPAQFVSHLPVHQDGTCNGLQHYAALGGDTWGAEQVNLLPGERPADVYSAVADIVTERINYDADELKLDFAIALKGKIVRKVVKQTVMTNVYGVTRTGAKKQILRQLEALYPNLKQETGQEPSVLAAYCTTKVFDALSSMFKGAHDIQMWLGEIGGRVCQSLSAEQIKRIAMEEQDEAEARQAQQAPHDPDAPTVRTKKVRGEVTIMAPKRKSKSLKAVKNESSLDSLKERFLSTIVWTTPLRMPVVQPYRNTANRTVATCLQTLSLMDTARSDPVNRRKQLQAFPPNFIHSLDASHMMLSALESHDRGLTFAAVHDSFWTHAADVDVMGGIIRDSFIRIHEEDVIGRLKREFEARFGDSLYLATVIKNTPVGRAIEHWRKSHKTMTARQELLLEVERLKLLKSPHLTDRTRGEEMVTPGSLFEKLGSPDAMISAAQAVEADADKTAPDADMDGEDGMDVMDGQDGMDVMDGQDVMDGMDVTDVMEGEAGSAEDEIEGAAAEQGGNATRGIWKETGPFIARKDRPEPRDRSAYMSQQAKLTVWLPLTFPDIPAKGDFDIQMLRQSKYFFS